MTGRQKKRLIIVADDYGISPAVSRGIRELAALERLSATGAMTLMPAWRAEAPALKEMATRLAVGLHFTLTDQQPLGAMPKLAPAGKLPSVGRMLIGAVRRALPALEIRDELHRQLDAFESAFGRSPDFIDGHQHVHVLPGVRDAVLDLFPARLDPERCWLRDCHDGALALLARGHAAKAGLISTLSARFAQTLRRRGLHANRGFSGFYAAGKESFAAAFPRMLAKAGDGHLLMVHPGHVDKELAAVDTLTTPRQGEWDFLSGDGLAPTLSRLGFALTRGPESWHIPAS